jgi:hypothetical protein
MLIYPFYRQLSKDSNLNFEIYLDSAMDSTTSNSLSIPNQVPMHQNVYKFHFPKLVKSGSIGYLSCLSIIFELAILDFEST